jgi:hypothetical protein
MNIPALAWCAACALCAGCCAPRMEPAAVDLAIVYFQVGCCVAVDLFIHTVPTDNTHTHTHVWGWAFHPLLLRPSRADSDRPRNALLTPLPHRPPHHRQPLLPQLLMLWLWAPCGLLVCPVGALDTDS